MKIKINTKNNDNYIGNLAFIKALLIKATIESLDVSYEEKVQIKNEILEYLQNNRKNDDIQIYNYNINLYKNIEK